MQCFLAYPDKAFEDTFETSYNGRRRSSLGNMPGVVLESICAMRDNGFTREFVEKGYDPLESSVNCSRETLEARSPILTLKALTSLPDLTDNSTQSEIIEVKEAKCKSTIFRLRTKTVIYSMVQ